MTLPKPKPSFSPYRRWGLGLQVAFLILLAFAIVVMVNYLSYRHGFSLHLSRHSAQPLSSRTVRFVESITNQVKITVYYDKDEPFFSSVLDLLDSFHRTNPRLSVRVVDYIRDPGMAQQLRLTYAFLATPTAKSLIIFDCEGRVKTVDGAALTKYVLEQVPDAEERVYRRRATSFEGEKAFTATLMAVTNPKPLKAYSLRGHGEHEIADDEKKFGFVKFANVLHQNYIQVEPLELSGTNSVPADCNLLVVPGPLTRIPDEELAKIETYLNAGGRMLALLNVLSIPRGGTGLEELLAKWNVNVSTNIVRDPENSISGADVKVGHFGKHPMMNPLLQLSLHLISPRAVGKLDPKGSAADGAHVEEVAFSGPNSQRYGGPPNERQEFPLIVAVEKGAIKDVITERGTTRMVIAGDSIFLANHQIDSAANRDFAGYAVNWLLDRSQLLEGIGPKPISEFRLAMTRSQLQRTRVLLLAGMPGAVLLAGSLVWLRRRK